jgi:hypothetical protein
MAKFNAGDMTTNGTNVYMISSVEIETHPYSLNCGQEMYNLDNGVSSFRTAAAEFDKEFEICK